MSNPLLQKRIISFLEHYQSESITLPLMCAHGDDVNPANGHDDEKLNNDYEHDDVCLKVLNLDGNDHGDRHYDYADGYDPLNRDDVNDYDLQ